MARGRDVAPRWGANVFFCGVTDYYHPGFHPGAMMEQAVALRGEMQPAGVRHQSPARIAGAVRITGVDGLIREIFFIFPLDFRGGGVTIRSNNETIADSFVWHYPGLVLALSRGPPSDRRSILAAGGPVEPAVFGAGVPALFFKYVCVGIFRLKTGLR